MNAILGSFISAVVFGIGLAISGMIDPAKVQGFLDITGRWNPSLALVMGAALAVTSLGFAVLRKRGKSILGETMHWPTRKDIDAKLLVGAALFGIGWGLAGYCPGPALGSLALGSLDVFLGVLAMGIAMWATLRVIGAKS